MVTVRLGALNRPAGSTGREGSPLDAPLTEYAGHTDAGHTDAGREDRANRADRRPGARLRAALAAVLGVAVLGVLGYGAFGFAAQVGRAGRTGQAAGRATAGPPHAATRHSADAPAAPATAAAPATTAAPPSAKAASKAPAAPSAAVPVPSARTLVPVGAAAFGPQGTADGDNPQNAARVLADPALGWQSDWYATPEFGGLQAGTGLLLDMGQAVTITAVKVTLGFPGADLQLRAGAAPALAALPVAATAADAGRVASLPLAAPVRARYVLLWFTRLPPDGTGTYQAFVHQVTVQGRA